MRNSHSRSRLPIDGAVIVTTPQDVALLDARRAVKMFRQVHCPILGIVENMSVFVCPDCGQRDEIFGHGGADKMAAEESIPVLARVPIYTEIREGGDRGVPITVANPKHPASQAYLDLAKKVVASDAGRWMTRCCRRYSRARIIHRYPDKIRTD